MYTSIYLTSLNEVRTLSEKKNALAGEWWTGGVRIVHMMSSSWDHHKLVCSIDLY
jgi:hypothetical protein